jgi:hypothetical protein
MTYAPTIRSLARDGTVISRDREAAELAHALGYRAVFVEKGGEDELGANWGTITRRNADCCVIGEPALMRFVQSVADRQAQNNNTAYVRSRIWATHLLANIDLLWSRPTLMNAVGSMAGCPAFIVGAGPSLDRNWKLLDVRTGKGLLIAVNSAARVIEPSMAFSVECNDIAAKMPPYFTAALGITSHPKMIKHARPFPMLYPVWAGEISWIPEKLTGIQRLPCSGSSSTAALALAHRLGCDPIVLVGQDCAHTNDRIYAESTGFDAKLVGDRFDWGAKLLAMPRPGNPLPETHQFSRVKAWGGTGTIRTDSSLRALATWFAQFAAVAGQDAPSDDMKRTVKLQRTLINATEGGASIPGWREESLSEVLAGLPARRVALETNPPPVTRDAVETWLRDEAVDDLLDAYALPDVHDELAKRRASEPWSIPLLEAIQDWADLRRVERVSRRAREALATMVRR